MTLTEHLSEAGVNSETLLQHLKWSVGELRNKDFSFEENEQPWKFKREILLQNTETLIFTIERELMGLSAEINFTAEYDDEKIKDIERLNSEMLDHIKQREATLTEELRNMEPEELIYKYLEAKFGSHVGNTPMPFFTTKEIVGRLEVLLDKLSTNNN